MVEKKVISSAPCINFKKVKELPLVGEANTVYYVKGTDDNFIKTYVTDTHGNPTIVAGTQLLPFSFPQLLDVPHSYAGQANKFPAVNSSETGLIFKDISSVAPELPDGVITAGTISFNSATSIATITSPFTFRINQELYTPTQTTVNLASRDLSNTRIDLITGTDIGANGGYSFVTGIASSSPIIPSNPVNTVIIAQVYRYANGTDLVIINNNSGYLPIIGGDLFGGLKIKNGNNLFFDAANTTDDSGDIIWRDSTTGTPIEMTRLLSGTNNQDSLKVMFDGNQAKKYDLIHEGNILNKVIDDSITTTGTTWSGSKIETVVLDFQNPIFNDNLSEI